MLGSYRGVIFAAVGWLALTGQAPKPDAPREQAQADRRVGDALANISATYREQAERAKRTPESPPCGPAQYDSKDDLCAQWKAADAAADSAWWAWVSAILSGVSLGAVAVALGLTIQSNRIARDTAKRQLRAYITLDQEGVPYPELTNKRFQLKNKILNVGDTPAKITNVKSLSFVAPHPLPKDHVLNADLAVVGGWGHLHKGCFSDAPTSCDPLSPEQLAGLMGPMATLRVWAVVRVEYTDVFGDDHVEQMCGGTYWVRRDLPRFEFANVHQIST